MFNKTTSANFLKFGQISETFSKHSLSFERFITDNHQVNLLKSYDHTVYISPLEGMAMLVISEDPELDELQLFAIHRNISIKKGMYFAIVPMTTVICYDIYYNPSGVMQIYNLPEVKTFDNIQLKTKVENIIAYYYVVKSPNYVFPGETHYLYELTYVDNGSLQTTDRKSVV